MRVQQGSLRTHSLLSLCQRKKTSKMVRRRRYNAFLFSAAAFCFALFYFTEIRPWTPLKTKSDETKSFSNGDSKIYQPGDIPVPTLTPQALPMADSNHIVTTASSTSLTRPQPLESPRDGLYQPAVTTEENNEDEEQSSDAKVSAGKPPKLYWQQLEEHFPIPPEELISLPTGSPRPLPKIQYDFEAETSSARADRLRQQKSVKDLFQHAWSGYKKYAMSHDELRPLSNSTHDPFNGWGATLVDSLDSLWIMGLKDDFEEAVALVKDINFKTSKRKDIPLFETTIRYLGGLIGAYDVSDHKYIILLDKAVELADVLLGAFDTPNRMPVPYYRWAPSYVSRPQRSSNDIVMSELGSLAVEFTRLAQLTKEQRYYDAIARVTDALQEWQTKTSYPGIWPVRFDASGCKNSASGFASKSRTSKKNSGNSENESLGYGSVPKEADEPPGSISEDANIRKREVAYDTTSETSILNTESKIHKDDLDASLNTIVRQELDYTQCEDEETSTKSRTTDVYSIGAMADSTYEYFPKEYALLGGLNSQYQKMYEDAMEVVRKDILYRPMTIDDPEILFPAKLHVNPETKTRARKIRTTFEGTHLGCFAGGMFALGSKVFGIPSDMKIAKELTNGCVWAYESTPTGIMPEEFTLVPCDDATDCQWNETRWHEHLDWNSDDRIEVIDQYNREQTSLWEQSGNEPLRTAANDDQFGPAIEAKALSDPSARKRDVGEIEANIAPSRTLKKRYSDDLQSSKTGKFVPQVALSHEKYVAARITEERLPPGYTSIQNREYILRPEAIESVFIMYRITGDESWRAKGWKMFTSVASATRTKVGAAALSDVTSLLHEKRDSMESFWLAETLKYHYLLFSETDLISLDEYIFNTEAHPFRLPK